MTIDGAYSAKVTLTLTKFFSGELVGMETVTCSYPRTSGSKGATELLAPAGRVVLQGVLLSVSKNSVV